MTRVFVFTNHKGGVGKSTSATNIAFGITQVLRRTHALNCRVLLIDTDSQGHASLVTTGRKDYGADDSLYSVLMADRPNAVQVLMHCIVQSEWHSDLHVLPSIGDAGRRGARADWGSGRSLSIGRPLKQGRRDYAAVVIDTRPSFSLLTEMGLLAASDAIVPVKPRYLETLGLMSVIQKINDIRDGWRHPSLRISGLLVTKMNTRIRGHNHLLDELKAHTVLGNLLLGVIPANAAVSYPHHNHLSLFTYEPNASASKAYAQVVAALVRYLTKGGAS